MKKVTEQQLMSATSLLREYIAIAEAGANNMPSPSPVSASAAQAKPQPNPPKANSAAEYFASPAGQKTAAALKNANGSHAALAVPKNSMSSPDDGGLGGVNATLPKNSMSSPDDGGLGGVNATPIYNPNKPSAGQQKARDVAANLKQQGGSGKQATNTPVSGRLAPKISTAKPDPTVMFQQQELNKRGAGLTVNGIKDQKTINALKQYNSGKLTPYVDPGSVQGQALRQQTAAPKPATAPRPAAPRANSVDSAMGSFATESSYSDVPTLARITQLAGL